MNMDINLQNFAENFAFLCFMLGMVFAWASLIFTKNKTILIVDKATNIIGSITLAAILVYRWVSANYFPISNLYESMLFLAWGLSFGNLIIKNIIKTRLISAIITPIVTSIIAFASLILPEEMQKPIPLIPALKSNWLLMHVSVMMVSYATLLIGCLFAIAFLILSYGKDITLKGSSLNNNDAIGNIEANTVVLNFQSQESMAGLSNTKIVQKQDTKFMNLLESFDNISYRFIGLGFPFLTLGIISGAVWANQAWGSYWSWDPKETWSLIAWLVFATYLHTRITKSWQGRKPAYIATLGFVTVWICYLGVNFLGKGLHSYGWVL
mmetsp:Transcript_16700/g.56116  ORF Transcript_16700/g.56116 Transcript_16700/m.56116 type:complete len:324 (-) Transcript_16700:884-1855(-)